jgi:hypothetical protein
MSVATSYEKTGSTTRLDVPLTAAIEPAYRPAGGTP